MPYDATGGLAVPSRGRRLTDKLFLAFHQACDQADFDVAALLLSALELIETRPAPQQDRRRRESLVAGYERLWHLRHPMLPSSGDALPSYAIATGT
jgi:hypothetical protein